MPLLSWRSLPAPQSPLARNSRPGKLRPPSAHRGCLDRAAALLRACIPVSSRPAPIPAAARAGCACGGTARRRSLKAAGAARQAAWRRMWLRPLQGRWTGEARRASTIVTGFRSVWFCWSRAGSRTRTCARRCTRKRPRVREGWAGGWSRAEAPARRTSRAHLDCNGDARYWGWKLDHPEGLTALVPRLFVDAFGALPLRVAAGRTYLGFGGPPRCGPVAGSGADDGARGGRGPRARVRIPSRAFSASRSALSRGRADRSAIRAGAGCCLRKSDRTHPARGIAPGARARLLLAAHGSQARQPAAARARFDPRSDRLRPLSLTSAG